MYLPAALRTFAKSSLAQRHVISSRPCNTVADVLHHWAQVYGRLHVAADRYAST
jgi:hypothetical protein